MGIFTVHGVMKMAFVIDKTPCFGRQKCANKHTWTMLYFQIVSALLHFYVNAEMLRINKRGMNIF